MPVVPANAGTHMWTAPCWQEAGCGCDRSDCGHMSGLLMRSHMTAAKMGSTARVPNIAAVCPAKAGMFSRRQTCRGRSQSPVVWIAEVMETETLKPIDKVSPGEAMSHRAVIKVNALWPRKGVSPRAEPSTGGRRPHEQPKTDRYGCSPRRGGSDSTVTRTCRATGEALLVPTRNRRSKVGRITGENREVGRRREDSGWVRSSNEAE